MSSEFYLLIAIAIVFISFLFLIFRKVNQLKENKIDENLLRVIEKLQSIPISLQENLHDQSKSIQNTLVITNKNIADVLQQSNRSMNDRLDNAAKYISQVSKEIGQMSELGKSMKDLQAFLLSPKLRGHIGEQVLKDLIKQTFPKNSFHLQYTFKSGEKVDAAIKTAAGILPIDSKFPLENFKKMTLADFRSERVQAKKDFVRDVKKHIIDISKKYILPEENTVDFAFMYLPSEAIFSEIANNEEIMDSARKHRIYPVSPNTLYAHLQTVLLAFEGQKIEESTKKIFRILKAVQKDYEKIDTSTQILGRHINNAYNQFPKITQILSIMGQKLTSMQALPEEETVKQLKPED